MNRHESGQSARAGRDVRAINGDGRIIGLDIGATAVRATVLTPVGSGGIPSVALHALGHVDLPLGAVVDGVVQDQAAVTGAIKHLARENGFASRNVILGTSNQQVVVREVRMPYLPPEQLRLALPFQARDVVALPINEAVLDFIPLGEVDNTTNTVPGLLVAAPRLPVLTAVHAVERAGLRVAKVDLSSFAALRFVAQPYLAAEAIVDLGAHLTSIVIHSHGVPKVVRTVARGGQQLTDELADRADLSLGDAELAKCQVGIAGEGEVPAILAEGIRPLLAEIRSSLHFFGSMNPDVTLERISLTGGTAWLPGLTELLASQHGIAVEVVAPAQHIETRWSTHMRQMGSGVSASAVSVGLAMGAAA
jgi:type IV pilus assembly protein PilM